MRPLRARRNVYGGLKLNSSYYHEEITETLYSLPQVAKILHASPTYVRNLVRSGALRGIRLGEIKVTASELQNFLVRNTGNDLSDPYNIVPLYGENSKF